MKICGGKSIEKSDKKSNLLIQNKELLRLRLTNEEKVFYSELYYNNAIGGKVIKSNFLPLLGMLDSNCRRIWRKNFFSIFLK